MQKDPGDEQDIESRLGQNTSAVALARARLESRKREMQSDFIAVASTPEGRRVLNHIMKICGWHEGHVGGNPAMGMDILHGTFYNATRAGVYKEIREFIPKGLQKEVEFMASEEIN